MKDTQIRALKAENGKTKRKAISNGLFIEARPSGKKIFIFRYQWNKKPQTITLGQYPTLTLGEASAIALEYQELLLKDIDPRSKDSEEPRKLTFSEVAEQWHQKNKHFWKDVTKNRHYKSLLRDIYPFIGHRPIDEITKAELLALIHPHEIKGHDEIAHRLHDRLETIFKFAVGSSLTENYPFIGQGEWNIPAERMKMAAAHWVPLSPQVLKILKELRVITGFTPYLFNSPTTKKPQPISETSARKLLHNSGYKDRHTLHGFRALASTVLHEQTHFRTDAIEAQLAHKVARYIILIT